MPDLPNDAGALRAAFDRLEHTMDAWYAQAKLAA